MIKILKCSKVFEIIQNVSNYSKVFEKAKNISGCSKPLKLLKTARMAQNA